MQHLICECQFSWGHHPMLPWIPLFEETILTVNLSCGLSRPVSETILKIEIKSVSHSVMSIFEENAK